VSDFSPSTEIQTPFGKRWGLRAAHAVLASSLLIAFGLTTGIFAWPNYGSDGVAASLAAVLVCWCGAALALMTSKLVRGPQHALAVTMLGMITRMGLPLMAVVVVTLKRGALSQAGFLIWVVIYYGVTLMVETWLSLKLVPSVRRTDAS
jgi:hypothetical protein